MTIQISDELRIKDKEFCILTSSKNIPFYPKDYGLEPESITTNCWKGYWCKYSVENGQLLIEELYIHTKEDKYPMIYKVGMDEVKFVKRKVTCWSPSENKIEDVVLLEDKYYGHRVYRNLNIPMKYTGKLLYGEVYLRNYGYIMGAPIFAYKTVVELEFVDGVLVSQIDYSKQMIEIRKIIDEVVIDNYFGPFSDNGPEFIKELYFTNYENVEKWLGNNSISEAYKEYCKIRK